MTFWLIYIGVFIINKLVGGDFDTILCSMAFNNAVLLFGPLHYLDVPVLQAWVAINRMPLTLIMSCILAYYSVRAIRWLAEFYDS